MHLCAKSEGQERVKENLRRRERMGVAGVGSHAEVGGGVYLRRKVREGRLVIGTETSGKRRELPPAGVRFLCKIGRKTCSQRGDVIREVVGRGRSRRNCSCRDQGQRADLGQATEHLSTPEGSAGNGNRPFGMAHRPRRESSLATSAVLGNRCGRDMGAS